MNIDSPFEQWRLKYMKGTAASREIMELLALAFEGGRVAEREHIKKENQRCYVESEKYRSQK